MKTARTITYPLSHEFRVERVLLRTTIALLIGMLGLYVYFITDSALSVIAKNEAERNSVQLESTVGELETKLFAMSEAITPESASTLGLIPVEDKHFVRRLEAVGRATTPRDAI